MIGEFVPIVAAVTAMVVVPISLYFRHLSARRELEHKERMRAIETGYPLVNTGPFWPCLAAAAIGGLVPCAGFLFAFLVNVGPRRHEEAWIAAALVGFVAVLSGAKLVSQILAKPREAEWNARSMDTKPAYDPDAYDTVSRRG